MRSAWPHQRENDPDRHCVATVLPHNAMFSLTFAGVASVDLSEPPFCNVLSFAVIRRYSAACHTTSYSGENGLVWYGPHDLIVGHAGRGMIFVRCSRPGSGENGKIFRLVACHVLRLPPRKDLSCWQRRGRRAMGAAGCGGAQSALTDSRKPTEAVAGFHARRCRAMEAVVRYGSHVGFAGNATTGRADYGQEHHKAAKAQVPQDAEEQAAMPLSDTLGVVRSALCGDPRFADPCGAALYGSKACADFANEATRIHARRLAQQLERQLDQRPASS